MDGPAGKVLSRRLGAQLPGVCCTLSRQTRSQCCESESSEKHAMEQKELYELQLRRKLLHLPIPKVEN
eukprot:3390006-Amphidinium_carterae.1